MKVACACPRCGMSYVVREDDLVRQVQCRRCGQTMLAQRAEDATGGDAARIESSGPSPLTGAAGKSPRIGRFEVRARLGAGAFGAVYQAYDPVLAREVALKVPHSGSLQTASQKERFLQEAKAAAQLRHPNIVPVYEAGVDRETCFIASAFIEGRTLQHAMEEKMVDLAQGVQVVRALAEALNYAHRQGVVHRDVKPGNVMLDAKGQPVLMDFGLARLEDSQGKLTQVGTVLGTPAYMSPEQAGARHELVGPASDQYSLGVILYEVLCGQTPFAGPPALVIGLVMSQEPDSPRKARPEVPRDLETICLKAMSKEPAKRYADCGALAEDLRCWQADEPIRARRVGSAERCRRWCRRNPTLAVLTGVAVALLVLTAVVPTLAYWKVTGALAMADAERQRAESQRQRAEEQGALATRQAERARQQKVLAKSLAERAEEQAALAQQRALRANEQKKIAEQALARLQAETVARKAAETEKQVEAAKRAALSKELDQQSKALQSAENQAESAERLRQEADEAAAWITYTDNLKAADRAFAKNQPKQMLANLDACPESHRAWEWHFLKALAAGKTPTVTSVRLAPYVSLYASGRLRGMNHPSVLGSSHDGIWLLSTVRGEAASAGVERQEETKAVNLYRLPQSSPVAAVPWNMSRGIITGFLFKSALVSPTGQAFLFIYASPDKQNNSTFSIAFCGVASGGVVPLDLPGLARVQNGARDLIEQRTFAFSPDGAFLVVCWSEKLMIFDGLTGRRLRQMADRRFLAPPCFTPEGELAVLTKGDAQTGLFLWKTSDKKAPRMIELPSIDARAGQRITISRDGVLWAIGASVVEIATGEIKARIPSSMTLLAFSPDGKRLATVGVWPNRDMLLWDVDSQRALPRLESFCRNGIYNSDWTQIITIGAIGAQVWTMPPVAVSP